MEAKGIEKSLKLVEALDKLVGLGEDIMKDGKVDMNDIVHLPSLAPILGELFDAYKEKDAIFEELKDVDWEEFKKLVEEAID